MAKTDDIEPSANSPLALVAKGLGGGTLARIANEGISRKKGSVTPISYQAYAINYEQVKEFIGLISDVERKQLQNPEIRQGMIRVGRKSPEQTEDDILHAKAIFSYVPTKEEGDEVTFEWEKLQDCQFTTAPEKDMEFIIQGMQRLHVGNTCRTTSVNIVEAILGFATDISKYFFIAPKYQTTLDAGQPNKDTFYVLPPPPSVHRENAASKQFDILNKLYKRMSEIPKLNPGSPETRAKFEALKSIYKDAVGANNLSATELMRKIMEHDKVASKDLFHKREPNFLSRFFTIKSTTERMFKDFEKDFQDNINKETHSAKP